MLNIYTREGHKLQPGELAGLSDVALDMYEIIDATNEDMPYLNKSFRNSWYSDKPGYREYKVALVIAPNRDYHWYRQDSNGRWSHKRGLTAISNVDVSGDYIYDPANCDRNYGTTNYTKFCGYYMVTY